MSSSKNILKDHILSLKHAHLMEIFKQIGLTYLKMLLLENVIPEGIVYMKKGHILKSAQNRKRHENKKSVQIRIDKSRYWLLYTSIKKSVNSCV